MNGGDAERSRNVVEVSVHIAARPETVFAYFTDPVRYTQWMGGDATLVAVPGGAYRIRMRGGVEAAGVFLEIDPPRRVVFTWLDRRAPGAAGDHPGDRHPGRGGRRNPGGVAPPRPAHRRATRSAPHRMGALP